jgi:hypothetical protein
MASMARREPENASASPKGRRLFHISRIDDMRVGALLAILGILVSLLVHGLALWNEWCMYIPAVGFFFFLCHMVCLGAMPVFLLLLIPKVTRWLALGLLIVGFANLGIGQASHRIYPAIRMHAFRQLALRSEPLVRAIHEYTEHYGSPPHALTDIAPEFLDQIPGTGMPIYPDYEYTTDSHNWNDNPWALYVNVPQGVVNWDLFMYLPLQNYPDKGYGGWIERVGQWGYVHE